MSKGKIVDGRVVCPYRGWRLDWKATRENHGDVAYAIPCPDRSNSGNWVLDPVPLKPAALKSVDSAHFG